MGLSKASTSQLESGRFSQTVPDLLGLVFGLQNPITEFLTTYLYGSSSRVRLQKVMMSDGGHGIRRRASRP
jgi:hypothetical protein